MQQPIYIIGAGAIGKALAVFLNQAGQHVVLIRGRAGQASGFHETIQVQVADQSILRASLEVSALDQFDRLHGIVVLANKSFGNESIAAAIKSKLADSPLIVMQNGLGVEQPFLDKGFTEVYRCVLLATSQFTGSGSIKFKPVSASPIGVVAGQTKKLPDVVRQLTTEWFSFRTETNIQPYIWKKVIANSVFNSICPLLHIDNGVFHRDLNAQMLANRVVRECLLVANGLGIELTEADVMENILLISKASDGQLISTLQDIIQKRPTEIATLNLAIVRKAELLGLGHRVTETRLLGELVSLRSSL